MAFFGTGQGQGATKKTIKDDRTTKVQHLLDGQVCG
jgi:hypothetical protein